MAPSSFRSLLGIHPSTASPSDSALLIIDAQNEYSKGALAVTNAEPSGKVIASLLEKYRAANGKIIHILHKTPDGAPIFTPGTELAEEFEELKAKVRDHNPNRLSRVKYGVADDEDRMAKK
jgi:nicotinamidase-related amidase